MKKIFYIFICFNLIYSAINTINYQHKILLGETDSKYLYTLPKLPDSINYLNNNRRFKYGHKFDTNLSIDNSGAWKTLNNGDRVWKLEIKSHGAYALKLQFDKIYIPKGAELFIYNKSGKISYGPYNSETNFNNGTFGSPLIEGDTAVIEFYQPSHISEKSQIRIINVVHDYTDIFKFNTEGRDRDCGENVACESAQEYRDQSNSVIYMIINEYTCSGTLLNNVNNDNTPYVLTAWHCIVGETSLNEHNDFIYYFNHESPTCQGTNGSFEYSVSGSTLLATRNENVGSDFALLIMDDSPPEGWNPFYAGWSNDESAPLISVGIHHPEDYPRKINYDDDYAYSCAWNTQDTHWCLSWDDGGTADGSSGSALFNSDKQVIGANTGSDGPDCSSGPDLYGKFSLSWDGGNNSTRRLRDWLDPNDTGTISIDGIYSTPQFLLGDINQDSEINILDVVLLVNIILGVNEFSELADINLDNEVNILDIVQLVNIILGINR